MLESLWEAMQIIALVTTMYGFFFLGPFIFCGAVVGLLAALVKFGEGLHWIMSGAPIGWFGNILEGTCNAFSNAFSNLVRRSGQPATRPTQGGNS